MNPTKTRMLHTFTLACTLAAAVFVWQGCGGCPWVDVSSVTVSAGASCLDVHVADGSGSAHSTGCVNPVLYGENTCAVPLVLPAEPAMDGTGIQVAPGETFDYEIRLAACDSMGDDYHATIDATLGAAPVTIEFDMYAP